MQMELLFCESKIDYWANRYMERQAAYDRVREDKVIGHRDAIQQQGYLTRNALYDVAYWKSHRKAYLTLENSDGLIREVTEQAFASTDHWNKLRTLTQLRGVGQPVASAILHHYDKEPYPILDFRALSSVGIESTQTYPFWPEYIAFCREIADRNGLDMRTLDRALWRYSKDGGHC